MPENTRWTLPAPLDIPDNFRFAIGGHPLVAETLFRRGYQSVEAAQAFLDPDHFQPADPVELPDSKIAWDLLINALTQKHKILVWGDFDVDGQTSTTTLVEGLRELGGNVIYHIPVRGKETHGISISVLEQYLQQGFDLLITCDTGISEHQNIARVRAENIPVVVTDHHTLTDTLPPANAVVNPQRLPEDHPLRSLPGVGVTYKLMEGLFAELGKTFDAGHYMELAALGIVSDVAEQRDDTRYLLQKGLVHLRHTQRVGLQTLYRQAELNPGLLNETHIGFQIAPRLNAVGRLGDANGIVELLTTSDTGRARVLATHIEALNAKRRFDTRQVTLAAENLLQRSADDRHAPAIVLHHPNWPGGVVGIVASRLVERYHKPTILLTGTDPVHGSARSIAGVNITGLIAAQSDLLNTFGGHPMAAGLSLPAPNLAEFKRNLLAAAEQQLKQVEVTYEIEIAQRITISEITSDLIDEIERLSPFGQGNPPLHFLLENLELVSFRSVGGQDEHRLVVAKDENEDEIQFIWWKGADEPFPEGNFDVVCILSQSDYKGTRQISAQWVDFHLTPQVQAAAARSQITLLDHRQSAQPEKTLHALLEQNPEAQVWAEGTLPGNIPGLSRSELEPADLLILWTTPPSQSTLLEGINRVKPNQIAVFGQEPQPSTFKGLIERIAGLAKYTSQYFGGETTLERLAAACAADTSTIRTGLQLWQAMGKLSVEFDSETVKIHIIDVAPDESAIKIYNEITNALFEESLAFRSFFKTTDLHSFFSAR